MSKPFRLNILSPEKSIYDGESSSLIAPGEAGDLGVLPDHAPLVTTLKPGRIVFKNQGGQETTIESRGKGFLEVLKNDVTVILTVI